MTTQIKLLLSASTEELSTSEVWQQDTISTMGDW
jgi:hypothetical protein